MIDNTYDNAMGSLERLSRGGCHLALDYTLPRMSEWGIIVKWMRVLDTRCGDDGLALAEMGERSFGIDTNVGKLHEVIGG
jgi:hypothetical protein